MPGEARLESLRVRTRFLPRLPRPRWLRPCRPACRSGPPSILRKKRPGISRATASARSTGRVHGSARGRAPYISAMASPGEKALHAALRTREFDAVYYFYGDDDYLKDVRVRELIDVAVDPATRDFNLEQRRGAETDAESIDSLLATPPMLAERRVAVIRDVDKLKRDARRLLDRYLANPASDALLLLVSPEGIKPDQALVARATAVEFAPLTGDRVLKWVAYHAEHELGRSISPEAVSLLLEAVGDDLRQLPA